MYNDGGFDFSQTVYTVSQEAPKDTEPVSEKKKSSIKLDDAVIEGAR